LHENIMAIEKHFKRTYLHVGLGKTGTTTIQRELLLNAKLLESEFDLYFPHEFDDSRPFGGNHTIFLSSLFGINPETRRFNIMAGLDTPEAVVESNRKIENQFDMGFRRTSAHNLLLSAEGVGDFNIRTIARLADWLRGFSEEIIVVACLRHPLNALSSMIQQLLKNGDVLEELYENPPYYPFENLFRRLENAFGMSNIVAYDFADAVKSDGGIVTTFFKKIGVHVGSQLSSTHVENLSMSHEAALLLSALNRQRPAIKGKQLGVSRTPNDINAFLSIPGRRFCAPQAVYERLEYLAAPDLLWLQKNYQIELDPLDSTPSDNHYFFSKKSINDIAIKISDIENMKDR
jgi:hypothetical protein